MCNLIMIYNVNCCCRCQLLMHINPLHMQKSFQTFNCKAEIIKRGFNLIFVIWGLSWDLLQLSANFISITIKNFLKIFLTQSESGATESGSITSCENDSDIEMEMKRDPQAITVPITVCVAIMIGYVSSTVAETASSCSKLIAFAHFPLAPQHLDTFSLELFSSECGKDGIR